MVKVRLSMVSTARGEVPGTFVEYHRDVEMPMLAEGMSIDGIFPAEGEDGWSDVKSITFDVGTGLLIAWVDANFVRDATAEEIEAEGRMIGWTAVRKELNREGVPVVIA